MLFGYTIWFYLCEIALAFLFVIDIIVWAKITDWLLKHKHVLIRGLWTTSFVVHFPAVALTSLWIGNMFGVHDRATQRFCILCWLVPAWPAAIWAARKYAPKKKKDGQTPLGET